ncbi:MAG: ClpXP protease specificity-enhancing factor [Burkholderiales bacterium]
MSKERSTKPYLIRALYEWCTDSGLTPYLTVKVDANTRVPMEHVKNGEIVLNISADATHRLTLGNEVVQFAARFSGASRECSIPVTAVVGIFARESGQGLVFPPEAEAAPVETGATDTPPEPPPQPPSGRPKLQVIK